MTNEETEQRITQLAGHINHAADLVRDYEQDSSIGSHDAGMIFVALSGIGLLLDEFREARKDAVRLNWILEHTLDEFGELAHDSDDVREGIDKAVNGL